MRMSPGNPLFVMVNTNSNSYGGFDFCSLHIIIILGLVYFAGAAVVLAVVSDV